MQKTSIETYFLSQTVDKQSQSVNQSLIIIDPGSTLVITYRFYKNPTGVTGGSSITPVNLKFNSVNTSVATLQKSPTVSANGTVKQITQEGLLTNLRSAAIKG